MNIEKKIQEKINKYDLGNQKIIVAVSGGSDSMALLYLLSKYLDHKNVTAFYVNHGLRSEVAQEEALVAAFCRKLDIDFKSKKIEMKGKSEEEARLKRYRELRLLLNKTDSKYILLGHHADDQLETIILKLIRGTSPIDLWGMDEKNGACLRPMLEISKSEIIEYCKKNKIKYVTDKTNKNFDYARNKIRSKVIPVLKEINPGLPDTVNDQKRIYSELKSFIEKSIFWARSISYKNHQIIGKDFKLIPIYIQKALIKEILSEELPEREISQKNVCEVLKIILGESGSQTRIGDLNITNEYGKLSFYKKGTMHAEILEPVLIEAKKNIKFGNFKLKLAKGLAKPDINNILLPEKLTHNLSVRVWKPGDKIVTIAGTKKLQDIFTDAKIPKTKRSSWPVIVSGDNIVWLPQLAVCKDCLKKTDYDVWFIEVKNADEK